MTTTPGDFDVTWRDSGKEPQVAPNPAYPDGIDIDASGGKHPTCVVPLPHPAKRIGSYIVVCRVCGLRVGATTAGRPDDPRSIKVPCKVATTVLVALLREFYSDGDGFVWLTSSQSMFGGAVPLDMIAAGRLRELVQVLRQMSEGVHL